MNIMNTIFEVYTKVFLHFMPSQNEYHDMLYKNIFLRF